MIQRPRGGRERLEPHAVLVGYGGVHSRNNLVGGTDYLSSPNIRSTTMIFARIVSMTYVPLQLSGSGYRMITICWQKLQ